MLLKVLIYTILLISIMTIIIDIIPIVKTWIDRVKIGRFEDYDIWNKSITKKGLKWLNNTPKIKVTDNDRLIVLDMIKGNYTKDAIQHWQQASLLLGIGECIKNNNDDDANMDIIKFLNTKFDKNGMWITKPEFVDCAILSYAIMKLENIDIDKYKPSLDYTWQLIKEHIGEDGTVNYRKFMSDYRYVDTIGFICPFLICYGNRYKKQECIELSVKQIKEYKNYGMLSVNNIPFHAYNVKNKLPLGVYGWGRGLGWYAIGLIDSWNELSQDSEYKDVLKDYVLEFAKSVLKLQQENGAWSWMVLRSETRLDSSTTATLSWFMLNASKLKEISKECLISVEKANKYLMSVTRRSGTIDFSQGDTKDIGVYSQLFDILPFTQGFSIRTINLHNVLEKEGEKYSEKYEKMSC